MEMWALIRAVSLGYLLGLVSLSLAVLLWRAVERFITPAHRATLRFTVLTGTFILNSLLAVVIYLGVVNSRILMTTSYFHRLMYGGWGLTIVATGMLLLGASLVLAWLRWQQGKVPRPAGTGGYLVHGTHRLRLTDRLPTIAIVGAWAPELWVNRGYWDQLDGEERGMAVGHEATHLRRRDNLARLLVSYITGLYAVLPWLHRWNSAYELDCELAVDEGCHRRYGPAYLRLVARAAERAFNWRADAVASHLTSSDHAARLRALAQPQPGVARPLGWTIAAVVTLLSIAPAAGLLLFPLSRCFCACYLGY